MIEPAIAVGGSTALQTQKPDLHDCKAAELKQRRSLKEFEAMMATQLVSQMLKESPIGEGESQVRTSLMNQVISEAIGTALAEKSAFGIASALERSLPDLCHDDARPSGAAFPLNADR